MKEVKVNYPISVVYPEELDDLKWYVIVKDKLGKTFTYDKDGSFKTLNKNAKESLMMTLRNLNFDKSDGFKISSKENMAIFMKKNIKLKEWSIAYEEWNFFLNSQEFDEAEKLYQKALDLWIEDDGQIEMRLWYSQHMQCFKLESEARVYIQAIVLRFYSDAMWVNIKNFYLRWIDKDIEIEQFIKDKKWEFNKEELKYFKIFEKNTKKIKKLKENGIKNLEIAIEKWNYRAGILLWDVYWCDWNNELKNKYFDIVKSKLSVKKWEEIGEIRGRVF